MLALSRFEFQSVLGVCVTARSVDHFAGLDRVASWRVFIDLDCVSLCGSFLLTWTVYRYLERGSFLLTWTEGRYLECGSFLLTSTEGRYLE